MILMPRCREMNLHIFIPNKELNWLTLSRSNNVKRTPKIPLNASKSVLSGWRLLASQMFYVSFGVSTLLGYKPPATQSLSVHFSPQNSLQQFRFGAFKTSDQTQIYSENCVAQSFSIFKYSASNDQEHKFKTPDQGSKLG